MSSRRFNGLTVSIILGTLVIGINFPSSELSSPSFSSADVIPACAGETISMVISALQSSLFWALTARLWAA